MLMLMVAACGGSGSSAGSYSVTALFSDDEVSVDDLAGEPVLLVSWATWCRECDEELAGLQAFTDSPEAEGVTIVAVNLDAGDADAAIQEKIDRHGLTVTQWRDRRNEFRREFGALGVPTSVVLNSNGEVVGTFPGAVDFDSADVLAALEQARDR